MACSLSVTGDVKVEHDWVDKVFTYRKRLDFKKVLLNADILLFYNSFPLFSKVVIMGVCMCVRAYTGVHKHICSPGRVENIKWL